MQTFLPYSDFDASAYVLDNRRLGKQRVEAYQILRTLLGETGGWRNHPAVKMWRGYEGALFLYGFAVCREWRHRGFKDTMLVKFMLAERNLCVGGPCPPWWDDDAFHASHRSNLLRKDPDFYSQYGWKEPHDLPYVWPI